MYAKPYNVTGLATLLQYGNDVSNGYLGFMLLITIFLISFIYMKQSTTSYTETNAKVFSASAFVTLIFAILLFYLNVVNDTTLYVTIILTAVSVFANVISNRA